MSKRNLRVFISLSILLFPGLNGFSQTIRLTNPKVVQGEFIRSTPPLRDLVNDDAAMRQQLKPEKLGPSTKHVITPHPTLNPNALPLGLDPALQNFSPNQQAAARVDGLIRQFAGMGYTSVNPSDNVMDVGPNHVVQMLNSSGASSVVQIWNKTGTVVKGQFLFQTITGLVGDGDPIVLYDQLADKWFLSEFRSSPNGLIVAVSQTPDPLGAYWVYSYNTTEFPDYPKYAVWPDAYYMTSNESNCAVYAFDRARMITGMAGSYQRFSIPNHPTLGFQTATPVDLDGSTIPPAGSPGLIMRLGDDGWGAAIPADRLEIFDFNVNWTTPASTTFTGPVLLPTAAFSTELCGYTSFSCIPQPGSGIQLDPLREVLMNKIQYRNFGTHASIVCTHSVDVDGADRAGIRWYELRKTGAAAWGIHQQGTYSPDAVRRWMGSIGINAAGAISIAYNASDATSVYPSLRYTGRKECDPLGTMTEPETLIVAGAGANGSGRYGDYNAMSVDNADGSFWFSGQYNPSSSWATRIANFSIGSCTPSVRFGTGATSLNESQGLTENGCLDYYEFTVPVVIEQAPSQPATVTLGISGTASQGASLDYTITPASVTLDAANLSRNFTVRVYNDGIVEPAETIILNYSLNANGGNATAGTTVQTHTITINDNDANAASNFSSLLLNENFNVASPAGWSIGNGGTATQTWIYTSSGPTAGTSINGTGFAFCNSDAAGSGSTTLDTLYSPVINTTAYNSLTLDWDQYFRAYTSGFEERIGVDVWNGSAWVNVYNRLGTAGSLGNWSSPNRPTINISAYSNAALQIRFTYNAQWDYWWAIDNVQITGTSLPAIQSAVNPTGFDEQYLGPNMDVTFFNRSTNSIMARIENLSAHDFGCVRVYVERAGTGGTNINGETSPARRLMDKSYRVVVTDPARNLTGNPYRITLYYSNAEKTGWEAASGQSWGASTNIIKNPDGIPNLDAGEPFEVSPSTRSAFNGSHFSISAQYNTAFSGFSVSNISGALPLQLLSFNATPQKGFIQLDWTTTNETNLNGFELQRTAGQPTGFVKINWQSARNLSSGTNIYSQKDLDVVPGTTYYYRLKQLDRDGIFYYSRIVAAKLIDKERGVLYFPNPANDQLNIGFFGTWKGLVDVRIFAADGRMMMRRQVMPGQTTALNISSLPAGIYSVKCIASEGSAVFGFMKK